MKTRLMLACGVLGGPLFITASLLHAALRDGFDLHKHQISTLSLGAAGWVQIAIFVTTGILVAVFAAGLSSVLREGRGRRLIPLLVGVYGVAMVVGGVFTDDPAFGFPAGAPEGPPATPSTHGMVHALGAVGAFAALIVASLAFAWRFAGERKPWWATYSAATGLIAGALAFTVDPTQEGSGLRLAIACVFTGAWLGAVALHHLPGPKILRTRGNLDRGHGVLPQMPQ